VGERGPLFIGSTGAQRPKPSRNILGIFLEYPENILSLENLPLGTFQKLLFLISDGWFRKLLETARSFS
jgi:hypothetical protein